MNTQKHLGTIFPEFDRKLTEAMDRHRAAAKKTAVALARKNQPTKDAPTSDPLFTATTAAYNQTYAEHQGIIKIEVHRSTHERLIADVGKRSLEIDATIETNDQENLIARRDLDGTIRPQPIRMNVLAVVLLGLLSFGEIFWAETAFEALGDMPIISFLIATAITIVQGYIAIQVGKGIAPKEGKRIDRKTIFFIAALAGMVVSMTVMRGYALDAMDSHMPSWVYFFVHVALIVGTVLCSRTAFPSKEERDEVKQLRERFEQIDARDEQSAALCREKKTLEKQVHDSEEHLSLVESQCQHLKNIVRTHFRETIAQCKTENLITRTDMGTPISFHAPAPLLEFEIITTN